jgi:XTP/dITP diphosphohydrolase
VRELVVATRSEGKLRELLPLLREAGWHGITLDEAGVAMHAAEAAIEVHGSYAANALAKARWFASRTGGRPVLADDSGLEVEALGGRPGVHSKRWAGRPDLEGVALDAYNNAALLDALAAAGAVTADRRRARYVCAVAVVGVSAPIAGEWVAEGTTRGVLLTAPVGDEGFGYDPLFLSDDLGRSFAEVPRAVKARVSHRTRAVRSVLAGLPADVGGAGDPHGSMNPGAG